MASPTPLELAGAVPLQRQRSMQSNIMFIQEEHAKTLKALHEEIRRLQTKCSELTFSVAMGTTSSPQEDFYREKADKLQKELEGTTQTLNEATGAIEKRDKRINTLEQQLRAQEKKYQDLLKNKEQQLRQVRAELTETAANNAELMLKRLSQSQENPTLFRVTATGGREQDLSASYPSPTTGSPRSTASASSRGSNSPVPPLKLPIAPHPPREGSGHRLRRRSSPRAVVAEGEPQLSTKVKPRAPSGRMLRRASNHEDHVPDPAPFLQRRDVAAQRNACPTSTTKFEPLPPIAHRSHRTRDSAEGKSVVPPQQVQSQAFIPKHKSIHKHKVAAANAEHSSGSSSPEVEVLAVDTVIKRTHKLRRAQEYNN